MTAFVEVAHQYAAPYRAGLIESSRPWTDHLWLLGEDVQEGLCRRRQARICALDNADLLLDLNVARSSAQRIPCPRGGGAYRLDG